MTEKEAIKDLIFFEDKLHNGIFGYKIGCLDAAIKALEEIQQYRGIGTVEECREAVERRNPKAPVVWGDGYDNEGNMIYDMYDCPNCGKSYEVDYHDYKFCPYCGQAILWENGDAYE